LKKSHIVNNIEKYYLNGLTKQVVWVVQDNKAEVEFATETKNAVGKVIFDVELPNGSLAIYSTDALLRLLGITSDEIQIELSKNNTGLVDKLKIQDNKFDLNYHLSDLSIIPEVPNVQTVDFDFSFKVDDEFISGFLKAHNALEKTEDVTLNTTTTKQGENVVEIILGERSQHSHKVKFTEVAEFTTQSDLIPFSANVLREILAANKGTEGQIQVSNKGLMKLEFNSDTSSAEYFVVRQQ
jgi:hypothetical protein|tara:strand:- start:25 stop:744 length:720 start_codon:yes stop_codon:yes gene_type:complete